MHLTMLMDAVFVSLGLYFLSRVFIHRKRPVPLPPGPKPRLFVGNLGDLPPLDSQEWKHWEKHKKLYGPLSCLQVLGQTIMVINDYKVALELFEKRSATYSERPVLQFFGEMCGWGKTFTLLQPNTELWRESRKSFHQVLGTKMAAARFNGLQEVEVRRFLLRVLHEPERLVPHIRKETGAIILKISHGYTVEPHNPDPLVDLADEALAQGSDAKQSGRWMVDVLPILKYIPSWLPGAGFKRTAAHYKRTLTEVIERPHNFTKQQMTTGCARPSYTAEQLERGNLSVAEEHVVKMSAMGLYSGGADTSVSSLESFFLAMTLYPEVQNKAQEELDRVIGTSRLPSFADRPSLPYIDAMVKEVLRWHTAVPMGLAHVSSADDVYEGMFIPKGTPLMPNVWLFSHDETNFKDPDTFRPERFLGENPEMDPHALAFGFGRRICPGRVLADMTLFLSIAMSLAVFDIRKATDDKGNVIEPKVYPQPGGLSHPAKFRCDIKPRSGKAEQLIRAVEEEYPWEESDAAELKRLRWEEVRGL